MTYSSPPDTVPVDFFTRPPRRPVSSERARQLIDRHPCGRRSVVESPPCPCGLSRLVVCARCSAVLYTRTMAGRPPCEHVDIRFDGDDQ